MFDSFKPSQLFPLYPRTKFNQLLKTYWTRHLLLLLLLCLVMWALASLPSSDKRMHNLNTLLVLWLVHCGVLQGGWRLGLVLQLHLGSSTKQLQTQWKLLLVLYIYLTGDLLFYNNCLINVNICTYCTYCTYLHILHILYIFATCNYL